MVGGWWSDARYRYRTAVYRRPTLDSVGDGVASQCPIRCWSEVVGWKWRRRCRRGSPTGVPADKRAAWRRWRSRLGVEEEGEGQTRREKDRWRDRKSGRCVGGANMEAPPCFYDRYGAKSKGASGIEICHHAAKTGVSRAVSAARNLVSRASWLSPSPGAFVAAISSFLNRVVTCSIFAPSRPCHA